MGASVEKANRQNCRGRVDCHPLLGASPQLALPAPLGSGTREAAGHRSLRLVTHRCPACGVKRLQLAGPKPAEQLDGGKHLAGVPPPYTHTPQGEATPQGCECHFFKIRKNEESNPTTCLYAQRGAGPGEGTCQKVLTVRII